MSGIDPLARVERACVVEIALAGVRHDVRNRLAAVRQAAFFLRNKTRPHDASVADPRIDRFFALIDEEIDRANSLLGDAEPIRRIHARAEARFDARASVVLGVETASRRDGVSVTLEAESGRAFGDPHEVALAVRCLVENAVCASPVPGRVAVVGRSADDGYELTVRDEGTGIGPELRESLASATGPGSAGGLGLAIAHRVARRDGGRLSVADHVPGFEIGLWLPAGPREPR